MIKYILPIIAISYSTNCLADFDSNYKAEFQKNYFQTCYRDMTTGADKVEQKLSHKICSCLAEKTVSALPVSELRKYNKDPMAYKDFIASTLAKCLI